MCIRDRVGPVRTGKSTFIKRFMETHVLPNIQDGYRRYRARYELPHSGSGRTIMTAEPKFVPEEAVEVRMEMCIRDSVYAAEGLRGQVIVRILLPDVAVDKDHGVLEQGHEMCIRDSMGDAGHKMLGKELKSRENR